MFLLKNPNVIGLGNYNLPTAEITDSLSMLDLFTAIVQSNILAESASDLIKEEFGLLKFLITFSYKIVTAIAGFLGFTTWKNLKESRERINELVEKAVAKEIAERVNQRITEVERIVQKEAIVSSTEVKYCLPMLDPDIESLQEYQLLTNRGFKISSVENYERKSSFSNCDVVVMDFVNGQFSDNDEVISILEKVVVIIPEKSTIVIYIKCRVDRLDNTFTNQDVYYTPANNILTLMGRVIDAAQINKAFKGLK